ncbi:hypothetical protein [Agathobaculum sp.]|uniref:DUF4376 domain-containing protein n=1 Tax=Agathobaculum sp. TaxID=2048138 RepID=UPI0039A0752F
MEQNLSKVYVLTDDQSRITRCEGGFTTPADLTDWVQIDEGTGDRYNLCQSHYFDHLYTDDGIPRYKLVDGAPVLRSEEEIEADRQPNIADLRAAKTAEMSAACNAAITAGMDVTTTQGTEHFSLQETDQINLTAAVTAVQQGAAGYPYHADGELCRMFTAAEIGAVGEASIAHKLYHTTYCNHLFAWIRRATASELAGITYGAELPEDLAASMQALLTQAGSTTGEV